MIKTISAFLLLICFTAAAQPTAVDITKEPHHHLAFENMFVKVFKVDIPLGQSTLMHRHDRGYLGVSLSDTDFTNAKAGAQPAEAHSKIGDVKFTPGGFAHEVKVTGGQPFRNLTVELVGPSTAVHACTESCVIPVPCSGICASVQQIVAANEWSVTSIMLPPGAAYPEHTHLATFLVMAVSDLNLKEKVKDGPEREIKKQSGETGWYNTVVHTITNTGSEPARYVVLEFRGRPAGIGSESMGNPDKKARTTVTTIRTTEIQNLRNTEEMSKQRNIWDQII